MALENVHVTERREGENYTCTVWAGGDRIYAKGYDDIKALPQAIQDRMSVLRLCGGHTPGLGRVLVWKDTGVKTFQFENIRWNPESKEFVEVR